jgi:hypothetical protein
MSDCCSNASHPKKHRCPANGLECAEVPARTISHHIKNPWQWDAAGQRYFFCDDPGCDIVYFGEDNATIKTSQLRTVAKGPFALLCHCFGVTRSDALKDPGIRNFVVEKTKQGLCSCDTSNPSGRCCLKDFPRK